MLKTLALKTFMSLGSSDIVDSITDIDVTKIKNLSKAKNIDKSARFIFKTRFCKGQFFQIGCSYISIYKKF